MQINRPLTFFIWLLKFIYSFDSCNIYLLSTKWKKNSFVILKLDILINLNVHHNKGSFGIELLNIEKNEGNRLLTLP